MLRLFPPSPRATPTRPPSCSPIARPSSSCGIRPIVRSRFNPHRRGTQLKIRRLETFCNEFVGFVRLTAEDGATGWGQLSAYNSDITARVFHRQIAPWALGRGIDELEILIGEIERREHKFSCSYLYRAMAGLDTAIWDLRGRIAGKPVTSLIGGTPGRLRAYASSMKRDITPEGEARRVLELRDCHGFDAFKFRIGAECGQDRDEWEGRTEAIVPAIRQALGPEAALMVDANSGFSPARAIEIGRMLEAHGVEHYEEPDRKSVA